MIFAVLSAIGSYLLGSIPTSIWVGKWFYGIDIREHGSGNAGATNTLRVLGAKAAIPVFIFDVFKGFLPVFFAIHYFELYPQVNDKYLFPLLNGIFAVIGHIFPIYANFKGGKGVATLLGLTLAICSIPALLSFIVFIIVFATFRYVSLASLTAGTCFPFFVLLFSNFTPALIIFSILATILLYITHLKNIKRLINGTENKIFFKKTAE